MPVSASPAHWSRATIQPHVTTLPTSLQTAGVEFGRGSRIRTCDPLLPKQMRYQAALCPDFTLSPDFKLKSRFKFSPDLNLMSRLNLCPDQYEARFETNLTKQLGNSCATGCHLDTKPGESTRCDTPSQTTFAIQPSDITNQKRHLLNLTKILCATVSAAKTRDIRHRAAANCLVLLLDPGHLNCFKYFFV